MSTEKNFAKGFIFKRNANAPSFVVGSISVKVEEAIAWLQANQTNGWANLKVNQANSYLFIRHLITFLIVVVELLDGGQNSISSPVSSSNILTGAFSALQNASTSFCFSFKASI